MAVCGVRGPAVGVVGGGEVKTKHILETPEELLHAFFEYRSEDDKSPRATGEVVIDSDDGYLRVRLSDPGIEWEGDAEELLRLALKQLSVNVCK